METERILLIDDDEGLNHFLTRFFNRKGYEVTACLSGQEAINKIRDENFDLILLDYKMPGLNGLDTLHEIKNAQIKTPVIIMTAYGNTDTAITAMKRGAYDYLSKPFERKELSRIVSEALELNRRMKERVFLPDMVTTARQEASEKSLKMIGRSKAMQDVYKTIGQIAEKNVAVLLTGESGTGKELVAKAIFHHSKRDGKPFIAINCAAIPEQLFESELFGYEPGAFTGARNTKIGKIERANGGTCFLDEIGELSMPLQAKLLRVLQEGEFERLGGVKTIKVDVRIITATNRDLSLAVQEGTFREDLYWRLKVISIDLPPLRRRTEDIPELVEYFINRFGSEHNRAIRSVSERVMNRLKSYSWPGNIRELENCLNRAVILCAGDIITEEHIEFLDRQKEYDAHATNRNQLINSLREKIENIMPEVMQLFNEGIHANIIETVEETIIMKVLEKSGNNQVKAAEMLGISRNTLRHRLKKYSE
ncbi:MAG: sigma-54-dependent Fis family transcriptional regulator [Deltaproteobacteria bacterium]|nr:sigma-54-dependent Fis family transcriptional regulator [Deltaproteobacteria bacterium]